MINATVEGNDTDARFGVPQLLRCFHHLGAECFAMRAPVRVKLDNIDGIIIEGSRPLDSGVESLGA